MIIIGLTGSIGMGKSTAAGMLRELGIPVHEADDSVHDLLAPGAKGNLALAEAFSFSDYPGIYGEKNAEGHRSIDRKKLGEIVFKDDAKRYNLEAILHPLVRESQDEFIRHQKSLGQNIVALDIPLLFETGGMDRVDCIIVVTAPYFIQKMRALARPGMTEEKFNAILEKQTPDVEKRARADYVVHTGLGRAYTMRQLKNTLRHIKKNLHE